MKKTIAYAIDGSLKYQRMLLGSIVSFKKHNTADWGVRVYLVDCGRDFSDRLTKLECDVRVAPRTPPMPPQSYFPCSAAKCMALADVEQDEVVMTLDVDGLFLSSVDPLVDGFLESGLDIALFSETDKRGNVSPVRECWFGCPIEEFRDANSWMDKPILNCGMVLVAGETARRIGKEALRLVERYENRLYIGEQGPINAVVYDGGYKVFPLATHQHCILNSEDSLTFDGTPYLGKVSIDGKPVVYRHFGRKGVVNYQRALDEILGFGV